MTQRPQSFAAKIIEKGLYIFLLYRGYNQYDEQVYTYFCIPRSKAEALGDALNNNEFIELSKFGEIIASGYGDPHPKLMQYMEDNYGFNHEEAVYVPRLEQLLNNQGDDN